MGNKITTLRKAKGWSLEQLGRAMEPPEKRQQVLRYEAKDITQIKPDWIRRFARALGVPPATLLEGAMVRGLGESEVSFVPEPDRDETDLRLANVLYPSGRADTMVVHSPSLILRGYAVDDRILVDMKRRPREGDAVVAQIYDDESGTAETVLRVLRGSFLVAAATEERFQPLLLGDNHVQIKGVVVGRYSRPLPPADKAA